LPQVDNDIRDYDYCQEQNMKVNTRQIGNVTVAELQGEIDTMDTEGLGESLATIVATKPECLVLDFADVTYIASMGLSLLLKSAQDMRKNRGKLAIANVTPAVKTVLETVRLGAAIPIESTVEAAVARLTGKTHVPA
jgi:anti-sigma B factor antagonist